MKHPQTRLERKLTEEKAFNKKLKCVRNGSYPCRYAIQYKDKTLKKNWDIPSNKFHPARQYR